MIDFINQLTFLVIIHFLQKLDYELKSFKITRECDLYPLVIRYSIYHRFEVFNVIQGPLFIEKEHEVFKLASFYYHFDFLEVERFLLFLNESVGVVSFSLLFSNSFTTF